MTSARFDGQTVLVTGASRGLGRDVAVAFAAAGAFVYVGYRQRADAAEATLAAMRAGGGDGAAVALDVTQPAQVTAAVERALGERRAIDVLVNNAALVRDHLFAMMPDDAWDAVVRTNLDGAYRCCRAVVRPMIARKRGAIVNVASTAALRAQPGQAAYAAAKGGLLAFTRALAVELAPRGVRVNAVVPGLLATGMGARLDHRVAERARTGIPLGRFGAGREVAAAVLFLASERAAYLVGQALAVDGGLTA